MFICTLLLIEKSPDVWKEKVREKEPKAEYVERICEEMGRKNMIKMYYYEKEQNS